ncbi:hypothetical protein EGK_05051 [Macaca mulatta]|uniref:Uncharacterized protein n=1 Tax=Macaca mulatta TaxID=9544 RepID=G7NBA1_MACMU|nr:hypothetical protein EGK_05051 [Macaca mulatta]
MQRALAQPGSSGRTVSNRSSVPCPGVGPALLMVPRRLPQEGLWTEGEASLPLSLFLSKKPV